MNKSTVIALLASLAAAALSPLAAFAQDGAATPPTGAEAPEDIELDLGSMRMPPSAKPLAELWDATDRSDDAVKKAYASLTALAKAYKGAPALSDKVVLGMRDAGPGEQSTLDVHFGSGNDFRMVGGPMTLTSAGDAVFLEIDGNNRKYLRLPVEGDLQATLLKVLPSPLPFPLVQLRQGVDDKALLEAFSTTMAGPFTEAKIAGFRTLEGKEQVLITGGNGDMVISIDPATHLLRNVETVIEPAGAPPGMSVAFVMDFDPKIVAATEAAVAVPEANGRRIVESIDDLMMPVSIGEPAVDFALKDNTGKMVSLSDLKGSVVVLDFWATWCGPCQMALPKLDEFAKWATEAGKPVKVFGVDVWERVPAEEKAAFATSFWEKKNFSFPTLIDAEDKLIGGYSFQGIPVTVVIGLDGNIAAVHKGFDPEMVNTLKGDVEKALGAAGAAGAARDAPAPTGAPPATR